MKQRSSAFFTAVRILIGVGLLSYLGFSGTITFASLASLAKSWFIAVFALSLLLANVGLTSWRLCLLLKAQGLHLTWISSVRLTLIGIYFNVFLPGSTGGDLVRIYYAVKQNHGKRTEIATIILFDRLAGIFALVTLPLLIAPWFPQLLSSVKMLRVLLWLSAAGSLAMLVALIICFATPRSEGSIVLRSLQKLPLGKYLRRIYETVRAYRPNIGTLAAVVVISMVVHTVLILVILLLVTATSVGGAKGPMALLIPFGLLGNSLPLTPGGLGVGEVAFAKLFYVAGFTGGAEALLGWRALMALIGMVGLAIHLMGGHESPSIINADPLLRWNELKSCAAVLSSEPKNFRSS